MRKIHFVWPLAWSLVACSSTERTFSEVKPDAGAPKDGGGTLADVVAVDSGIAKTCVQHVDCDDRNACNGSESCDPSGLCGGGQSLPNSTPCSVPGATGKHFCFSGNCAASRCGDGVLDPDDQEQCDDGNAVERDGCESGCTFSCTTDAECDDGNACNGVAVCTAAHVCSSGMAPGDGASCGPSRVCRSAQCVPEGCGDHQVKGTEECDDGNTDNGDGCETDCKFSCHAASDCDDHDVCNGSETCGPNHACNGGQALGCSDGNACTDDKCDREKGCYYALIDADGDKHADAALGACGDDCDDHDATVFGGAEELCDGKDNNCNQQVDESAPKWFADCDGDGYAAAGATMVQQCTKPPQYAKCTTGSAASWTTVVPGVGTTDCFDGNADVKPGQDVYQSGAIAGVPTGSDYDYNCDFTETQHWTTVGVLDTARCGSPILYDPVPILPAASSIAPGGGGVIGTLCTGSAGWTSATAPACGVSGVYSSCSTASGTCARSVYKKAQECL